MLKPVQKLRWKYYNILLIVKGLEVYKGMEKLGVRVGLLYP